VNKNFLLIIIAILIVVCLVEGYLIKHERDAKIAIAVNSTLQRQNPAQRPQSGGRAPGFVTKGMKFQDSPLFSKAYKIFPVTGSLSGDAKKATTGWNIKTINLSDGSTQVNLVPLEAEDVQQEFIVKPGYSLYFIELNLADDATGIDQNRMDDMGVLVDQNGIVQ